MPSVIESIVPFDLCVGCGVCAAMCPQQNLEIRFDQYGEYKPYLKQDCMNECGLCYKVCPFGDGNPNEDRIGKQNFGSVANIKHDSATGHFLASFVGSVASEPRRVRSASGGLATWLLTTLKQNNQIDAAICVSPSNEPGTLFKYSVMKSIQDIESCSGSAYFPVQLSEVLPYIIDTPGRYAITALPCFAKAIRLAQMKNVVLRERIVYIIGITCGQMKNKQYTEYLAALSEVKGGLSKAHYRGKAIGRPASNYYFSCENKNGEMGKIFWNEGVSEAWLSRWFTLSSCSYCDDVFAECTDAVCMDAWLPEHVMDWRGTSLILVRSPQLLCRVMDGIKKGEVAATLVSIDKIKQSQTGLLAFKRRGLNTRLWIAKEDEVNIPLKRGTAKRCNNPIDIKKARLLKEMQDHSKMRFLESRSGAGLDASKFHVCIGLEREKMLMLQKVEALIRAPSVVIEKIKGGNR